MLKRIIIVAVLIVGIGCFAKSAIRIDVDGLKNKVSVKLGEASDGLSVINGTWLKDRATPTAWSRTFVAYCLGRLGIYHNSCTTRHCKISRS
jgi:hypothetical protein